MTEQECIEKLNMLNDALNENFVEGDELSGALQMAIKALEEISLYKQGGLCLIPSDVFERQCFLLDDYKELGTVEELRVARDKQVAKKPDEHNFYDEPHHYLCPECRNIVSSKQEYCEECGQKLDWSDEE